MITNGPNHAPKAEGYAAAWLGRYVLLEIIKGQVKL